MVLSGLLSYMGTYLIVAGGKMRKIIPVDIVITAIAMLIIFFIFIGVVTSPPSPTIEDSVVVIVDSFTGRLGSGVIIDSDGLVLTARHVMYGMVSPTIIFSDGAMCSVVEDIYLSPDQDVALLRIKSDHTLPPLKFGDSRKLRPGDPLYIIGAPLGKKQWHAYGFVARPIHGGIIDIDIHGGPGCSGCPLLDDSNRIVGIVTGGYIGMGVTRGVSGDLIQAIIKKYEALRYGSQEKNSQAAFDRITRETRPREPYN